MTAGHVAIPARLAARRRLAIFIPLGVGLIVGAVFWRAGERGRTAQPPGPMPIICEYPAEPVPPPPSPPPDPAPTADAWAGLERCLREDPYASAGGAMHRSVTVADVRRWVEIEHDPTWLENGVWWFPLSGEGDAQMPSGLYVGVPPDGAQPCPGAIVN